MIAFGDGGDVYLCNMLSGGGADLRDRGGGGGGFANLTADDWTVVGRALVNATTGNERDAFLPKELRAHQFRAQCHLLSSRRGVSLRLPKGWTI